MGWKGGLESGDAGLCLVTIELEPLSRSDASPPPERCWLSSGVYRPFVLRCRNRGAAAIDVIGEGLAVDEVELRLILVVVMLATVGDTGRSGKGD
jgi:hypothetical protein